MTVKMTSNKNIVLSFIERINNNINEWHFVICPSKALDCPSFM